jgi:hypothetical protein
MKESNKKVDVDFNEALRRIANTPKSLINDVEVKKEAAPPKKNKRPQFKAPSS